MLQQHNPSCTDEQLQCFHCSNPVTTHRYRQDSKAFCCQGCLSVYRVLNMKGLSRFYEIKNETGVFADSSAVQIADQTFDYCNDQMFENDYVEEISSERKFIRFYLEGIHCLACLWLIEKLPEYAKGVLRAQLSLESNVVSLVLEKDVLIGDVASLLASFGLRPYPLKLGEHAEEELKKEERTEFLRMGIAGAAMMNIMLYSISLYAGAPTTFSKPFGYIILLFSLPVLLFSARPFYLSAWYALKNKRVNLDFPIAFALIYGSIRGVIEVFLGRDGHYFDTLTVLVFLLLLSRYVVKKWGQKGLALNSLSTFLGQKAVLVKTEQGWIERHPDYLNLGDLVLMKKNEVLPADGVIIETEKDALLQTAMLTGEPLPQKKRKGERVLAGTQNVGEDFVYEIQAMKDQSEIGKVLRSLNFETAQTSYYSTLADKVATRLVFVIFTLAFGLLLYFGLHGDLLEGERRALSLIIITCPCALALATPLALARALNLANQLGIVLKNEQLLERISQIKYLFLDKTGTITQGKFQYLGHAFTDDAKDEDARENYLHLIYSLESESSHPLATCLREHLGEFYNQPLSLSDRVEEIGIGVSAKYLGHHYQLKSSTLKKTGVKTLGLYEDGVEVVQVELGDQIRPEVSGILKKWKSLSIIPAILSGDDSQRVNECVELLGLDAHSSKGELLPSDKAQIVSTFRPCLMVGDGANDALALQKADVGVAVKGSMQLSLKSCDIYLSRPGLTTLDQLLQLSFSTVDLIKRNLKFSLFYNVLGVSLATMGLINPLTAAILMPISSLTVLFSTIYANQEMRGLLTVSTAQSYQERQWIS